MSSSLHGARLPCLDGLRAIAVLLVILFHQEILPFGWVGVQIFFVLSGYLITRLLFKARGAPLGAYLRDFYGRRSLRIFPLYLGVVAALWLAVSLGIHMSGVAEGLPYAATYTYNIWHASNRFVHSMIITHFWSLCVEEQFYLVWPFLVYFCPETRIGRLLAGIVLAGPLVRALMLGILTWPGVPALPAADVALYVLMPAHVDAFAAGGYVALFPLRGSRKAFFASFGVLIAAGGAVVASGAKGFASNPLTWGTLGYPLGLAPGFALIWGYSLMNVCSALLIDCIAHRRFAARFFEFPALNYLGKISYGLYIFHYPVQSAVAKVMPHSGLVLQMAVQFSLTVLISSASFYLWEAPFSKMKDVWFPGASPARAAARAQ